MLSCFSHVWLCSSRDWSLPSSFVYGILQARTLEWIPMPSSLGSSWPRDWTRVSYGSCLAGIFLTAEPPGSPLVSQLLISHPFLFDSLQPHRLQHIRPPCPSPSPKVCPSSSLSHWFCHPAHLILWCLLLLLPSIFPSIRDFSSESVLCIRWPK